MAIDFSNVRLTIQQFQSVSDGKFNAGEVRLTSETGIEKVNNFVGRSWKNKVSLSHAEVIAIKQAFVKALQQGGVGGEALRRVREQLGLAPDRAVDTKLSERSLKPLSRQQIREILDQNAETINRTIGAGTIRTSAELHADVDDDTVRYRETKRNTTNAELPTRRTVTAERRISLFQALVAGDADFRPEGDRAEQLKMAKEALDLVLAGAGGQPRAGIPAKAVLTENGERRIELEPGMDEVAFVRKLEDAIVRLQGPVPGADAIQLRDAFRAVPLEERTQWINDMAEGGGDNVLFKVRTLIVSLLQDAGVDDYDSLSLPNRLPDAAARALLGNLAGLPDNATEEQVRQCLEMVRDMAEAEPLPHPAYVPATTTRAFNQAVAEAFVANNDRLFGAFKTLAADVLADVRAVFGPEVVGENAKIYAFVRNAGVRGLLEALGEGVRATPEALRNALRTAAMATAAREAMEKRVEARAEALGVKVQVPIAAANRLKLQMPDLAGRLASCRRPEDVAAVLDSVQEQVDVEVRCAHAIESCKRRFGDMARAALSAKTGIPVSALGGNVLSSNLFLQLTLRLETKIDRREILSGTPEQIEQAFRAEAERFAAERADLFGKVDGLALSDASKADLKEFLLTQGEVGFLDLDAILRESGKFDMAPLALALREGRSTTDIYNAMKPFAENVDASVRSLLAGKVREIGEPERTCVSAILLIAALDRHPGVRTDLGAFFARPDVVADEDNRIDPDHISFPSSAFVSFGAPPPAEAKAERMRQIGAGTPPPVFAQALFRAVQAENIRFPSPDPNVEGRKFSPEEVVAVFSSETELGKALAEILESFPDELTPASLEILARSALHHHGVGDVAQMVKSIREKYANVLNDGHFFELPQNLVDEAQEVLGEMRARFGAEWVPEGASYNQVVDLSHLGSRLRMVARAAGNEGRFMTVAEFRQAAEAEAENTLVEKVVAQAVRAAVKELGAGAMPGGFANAVLQGNPGLKAALLAAKTPDAVRAAIENARGAIRAAVELEARIAPLVRDANDAMAEKLAAKFHITAADAKRRFGYAYYLSIRLGEFKIDVQNGRYPGCREPGFSVAAAIDGIIDRFVGQYAEKLAIVDSLQGVSGETRDALKAIIQKQQRPEKPFVDVARAQKIAAKLDGAALLAALDAPDATDESRFKAIETYADGLHDAIKAEFPGAANLGSDEFLPVISLVRAFLVGSVPGLGAALERLANDPFVFRVGPHFQQEEHYDHPLRATVAATLF